MSWLFSQALVAEFSAGTCSAGAPFAPLSGSPTPQAFLSPDRMTAFSRLSRFGMTFKPLTDDLGAGVLTWCLAASLVRTFPQQERERESTEHEAECGDTWHESFARWDRDSCSWKTLQCSLLAGLDEFSETWPRWGMMRAGECSEQSMPVLRTSETGSGLWLTPTCMNIAPTDGRRKSREAFRASIGRRDAPGGLAEQVATPKFWPTPKTPNGGADNSANKTRPSGHKGTTNLLGAVKMWATPKCQDSRHASWDRNKSNLGEQVAGLHGGKLNPTWVEWLMGWPLGWTDLKPLETDKCQLVQPWHGGF
jgi:hypothetical protein